MQVHFEHRTRYETIDARYRPTEEGGDQQLDFRTRLQLRVATRRFWAYSETQDARITLDDSASTVSALQETKTKVLQLHGGVAWRDLGARKLGLQFEAGRFSRDFGFRRLIARNIYRNTTNAYDGVIARVSGESWSLQALATRPVFYTYPALTRDPRFEHLRFGGLYFASTARRALNVDGYALIWRDGRSMPEPERRSYDTTGLRVFGQFGPDRRVEYEVEAAAQWGELGARTQRAWFQHSQLGYNWPAVRWQPRLLMLWDHASGDRDPDDQRNGAFDPLLGARRFEFGPVGLYGLIGRSNLSSPGVWLLVKPAGFIDVSVQLRGVWLAEARDRWRPSGLVDPTGQSGTRVGTQAEYRLRYRFNRHVEFDGGLVTFDEGAFVRALKPSPKGRATFVYLGTEFKF